MKFVVVEPNSIYLRPLGIWAACSTHLSVAIVPVGNARIVFFFIFYILNLHVWFFPHNETKTKRYSPSTSAFSKFKALLASIGRVPALHHNSIAHMLYPRK